MPNDPAIMQMHLPPQQPLPPMQNKLGQPGFQPQPGFMMPPIGPGGPGPMGGPPPGHQPIGQPYSSFGGMNNLGGMLSNDLVNKSPFPPGGPVNQMPGQQQQQQQAQPGGGTGAGSSVGGGSAKAPGSELANLLSADPPLQQPTPPGPVGSSSSSVIVGNELKDQGGKLCGKIDFFSSFLSIDYVGFCCFPIYSCLCCSHA